LLHKGSIARKEELCQIFHFLYEIQQNQYICTICRFEG
jgi:hypothetical protein